MKNWMRNICQRMLVCVLAAAISGLSFCEIPMAVYAENTETNHGTENGTESGISDESSYMDGQGIVYTLMPENQCYVSGYSENIQNSVKIPTDIEKDGENYEVKGIYEGAFEGCAALKTVQISNTVTTIAADVFKGCSHLKEISVTLDQRSETIKGKTSVVTAKMDAGLLITSAKVSLNIGAAFVDRAVTDKKADKVYVKLFVAANDNYPGEDATPHNIILEKAAVKMLADSGKGFRLQVRDALGSSYYVDVKASDLKGMKGNLQLAVCKKEVNDITGDLKTDLKKVFQKNSLKAKGAEIFSYSFGEDAKTAVNLTIPIKDVKGAKSGSKVYVYKYDKAKHVFASVSFHPYVVSESGNIQLTIAKSGTYVVTGRELQAMSRKPSKEFVTEGNAVYYIDKNGEPVRGWKKLGKEYYYFDRKSGKMAAGKEVDSVKLKADGTARQTKASVARIKTMIKARAIVEKITKSTDSIEQKREKCFRWVFQFPYHRYRRLQPIYKQPGWEVTFANDIFDHKQGCCVSEAAAVAFMFHECGYEEVYVACDTGHAWTELEGRVYDPLFAEARGYSKYYNIPYSSYYMSRPVLKRKI